MASPTWRRAASLLVAVAMAPVALAANETFRIEVHPITTLDLSAERVLRGDYDGPTRIIAGELRLPVTSTVRVPAVVLLHGDAGLYRNQPPWVAELNAAGFAVFSVDSFSGRGAVDGTTGIGDYEGVVRTTGNSLARTVDAYRALALLARHPRIDASRVALMGFSSGGRVVLNSAMTRFASPLRAPGTAFAAFVALYPSCNLALDGDDRVGPAPIRIYIGAADRLTTADACDRYVHVLRAAGADATLQIYPGAFHGFDNPTGELIHVPDAAVSSGCNFRESGHRIVNAATGLPLSPLDRCISLGFDAGTDTAANAAVRDDVRRFLRAVLAAPP
jgi:dienelactone hydrolase